MSRSRLTIVAGVATAGRPKLLLAAIDALLSQTRQPERIFVCPATPSDAPEQLSADARVQLVEAPGRGLTRQRNAILRAAAGADVIVFFDDDFLAASDYLEVAERLFVADPDIIIATGRIIADGARTAGLSVAEAKSAIERDQPSGDPLRIEPRLAAYGCNMALRAREALRLEVFFDEALPLYGWLEDWDFCSRFSHQRAGGKVVWCAGMRGAHLGAKSGRQSGVRLGYSQIANPLYIARKGVMQRSRLQMLMARNVAANIVKAIQGDIEVDRLGRLRGNLLALGDALRGRLDPQRILSIE